MIVALLILKPIETVVLWGTMAGIGRDLAERTERKRLMLDADDDEENNGTVAIAQTHLAKRSIDRRLFYHRISIAVLSILLVLSILSNDSFSFWKESEHIVIASPVPLCMSSP
jgi:hypothetical protein